MRFRLNLNPTKILDFTPHFWEFIFIFYITWNDCILGNIKLSNLLEIKPVLFIGFWAHFFAFWFSGKKSIQIICTNDPYFWISKISLDKFYELNMHAFKRRQFISWIFFDNFKWFLEICLILYCTNKLFNSFDISRWNAYCVHYPIKSS